MAVVSDTENFTKLIEAVKSLTRNNVYLTMQLSNTMKINPEMAMNINIKVTQSQEPEDKRLTDKAIRKAVFAKNLDRDSYLWTHRFRVTKRHSIQTYLLSSAGHQRIASRKYIMGGGKAGK